MECKGILLDLDDTLYTYEPCHQKALSVTIEFASNLVKKNKDIIASAYKQARSDIHLELKESAASHNRMLYFQRMYELLGWNAQTITLETYDLYWNTFLEEMLLDEDTRNFIEQTKNIKICLVTDLTTHIQHRKIKRLNIEDYIDYMVSSEEAGKEKPHPYMFMLALKKLQLNVNDVIMIGDNLRKDIIGASNLGIHSFYLSSKKVNEVLPEKAFPINQLTDINKWVNFVG